MHVVGRWNSGCSILFKKRVTVIEKTHQQNKTRMHEEWALGLECQKDLQGKNIKCSPEECFCE